MKRAVAIAIVGAMISCETVPALAAPVLSSTALVGITAPDMLDQVRVRRGSGAAIGAGVAIGVLGAIAGAAAQNQYYYGSGYYAPGYYAPGYYGAPGYYAPNYYYGSPGYYGRAYDPGAAIALGVIGAVAGAIAAAPYGAPVPRSGQCWIETDRDRNYGYWGRCR